MVMIGGVASAFILLIVVFAAIVMRLKWAPRELEVSSFYKCSFVLSCIAIVTVAVITVASQVGWI